MNPSDPSDHDQILSHAEKVGASLRDRGGPHPADSDVLARLVDAGMGALPPVGASTPRSPASVAKIIAGAVGGLGAVALLVVLGSAGEDAPPSASPPLVAPPVASVEPIAAVEASPALAPEPGTDGPGLAVVDSGSAEPPGEPARRAVRRASAAEMLAAANESRREGSYRAARGRYRALISSWPGTREALAARMNLGKVELQELGKPGRALEQFRAYLQEAPAGNLAEEAMFLAAQCHRELGDAPREREALEALKKKHPSSPYAGRAATRLLELETR